MFYRVGCMLRCPRCLELYHELERVKAIGVRKGFYDALTPGANPRVDAAAEFRLWLVVHPRSSINQAWRGGWDRAWDIARDKLRDAELTRQSYIREVTGLRSKIGTLLSELSRLTDDGGR